MFLNKSRCRSPCLDQGNPQIGILTKNSQIFLWKFPLENFGLHWPKGLVLLGVLGKIHFCLSAAQKFRILEFFFSFCRSPRALQNAHLGSLLRHREPHFFSDLLIFWPKSLRKWPILGILVHRAEKIIFSKSVLNTLKVTLKWFFYVCGYRAHVFGSLKKNRFFGPKNGFLVIFGGQMGSYGQTTSEYRNNI